MKREYCEERNIHLCQFDGCRQTRRETKRFEKFLVLVRQMRHRGLKSLTTDSNKIWQKRTNGWSDGIQFNLVVRTKLKDWKYSSKRFLVSSSVCGVTYHSDPIPRITLVCAENGFFSDFFLDLFTKFRI